MVADSESGEAKESSVRTSTGTFYNKGADDIIKRIEKRVAQVTMIPEGKFAVFVVIYHSFMLRKQCR